MNRNGVQQHRALIDFFVAIAFVLLVATIAHVLFSHLGFNPTDDGFILAGSRRILDGQIPHRDFISIRPAGSHFLHLPFVLFGGDYIFWLSRYFVWIQFTSIAWIWTVVIARSFKIFPTLVEKFAVSLVTLSFSVHDFPIMAWHTVDALFLASLGVILCHKQSRLAKMLGYMLIGMVPLCRQNFLPMIPVAMILLNDWRQKRFWLVAAIPIAVYAVYSVINGAPSDVILQLGTYTDPLFVLSVGVMKYVKTWTVPWGILIGAVATGMAHYTPDLERRANTIWPRPLGGLILFGFPLAAARSLAAGTLVREASFGIFGAVVGATICLVAKEQKLTRYVRCGLLIIFTAWCTSISIGYRTPALATGPLILFLVACGWSSCQVPGEQKVPYRSKSSLFYRFFHPNVLRKFINVQVILLVAISLVAFGMARENHIYREQSASHLNQDLGDVLPGARLIRTNDNTYSFLMDLQDAKNMVKSEGKNYCIIPDVAANWVRSLQRNPLSIDWPQETELGNQELVDRVVGDLEADRGRVIVIVQKYEANELASGLAPLSDSYAVVHYVRSNFRKVGETRFFELYE